MANSSSVVEEIFSFVYSVVPGDAMNSTLDLQMILNDLLKSYTNETQMTNLIQELLGNPINSMLNMLKPMVKEHLPQLEPIIDYLSANFSMENKGLSSMVYLCCIRVNLR